MFSIIRQHILSCCSASSIRQGFNILEDDDGSGRENLMERDTQKNGPHGVHPNLLSPIPDSVSVPEVPRSSDCHGLFPTLFDHPPLVPLQSAGKITLGGAYRVNPGWPRWVDTSLFVVCSGDVQSSCILLLSPVGVCVQLGALVSHERDFTLFQTSFVVFRDIESGVHPPFLAIPHSLNLPITHSSWARSLNRWNWRLSWLKDVSRFPIQAVVFEEVEDVTVYNVTVQGVPGDDEVLRSAAGRSVDSDSEGEESEGYRSDTCSSASLGSGSSVHYTDSILDLVGEEWLIREGWVDSS
ncbi:hypothetical protein FIBSPDRAFT_1008193 [Athelia psychrophila]|uniref:Uncharacterized protein n=1 Tax=Athelia psychrophila TaxID=1759441 RepID=A0A166NXJ7_9AGAM|nr:hypothetical protein FIBSPDRAFT_1008193 [Fibularhizoctonia sp. CBS 109695]